MSMKRILALVLALIMCGAMAFAEEDLQTQLDAANARIAELEAAVELYKPFYDAQVVAEYDGGVIFLEDVLAEYAVLESMYAQYGMDLVAYGYDTVLKQSTLDLLVEGAARDKKAAELGLDQIDDATRNAMIAEAEANFETYIESVKSQFEGEGVSEEEVREQSIAYLESLDYSVDALLETMILNYIDEQVYNYIIKDVAITEEDVQATYEELIASDEASYSSDSSYNNARSSGATILWNPEGYRQVKHVLVKFSDEQSTQYSELSSTLDTLNAELEAVLNPAEETEEAAEETTEETVEPRTEEKINAEIANVQAEIDALYAELLPTAQEVIEKFSAGTSFAELIDEYNEDPGMQNEPTKTMGYAVKADSTTWDPAFTAGAMSIESVGGISEPVYGSYGIHIIYYESDVVSGAVELESVREYVEDTALSNKTSDVYSATLAEWTAEINPVYYYDRII